MIIANESVLNILDALYYRMRRDGLEVSVTAFHAVGRGFLHWLCHTKDLDKKVQITASLLDTQALG